MTAIGPDEAHSGFRRSWAKIGFAKGVGILAGATFLGQALVVLSSPILTRLYDPEDLGLLGVFTTIIGLIGYVACLKYELAIPLAPDKSIADALVLLCVSILVVLSILAGTAFYVFWEAISVGLQIGGDQTIVWFIPAGVFLVGFIEICQNVALLDKRYLHVARSEVVQNIVSVVAQLVLGAVFLFPARILVAQIIGKTAGALSIARAVSGPSGKPSQDYAAILRVASRYRDFPIYSAPAALVSYASRQLPMLLLAAFFGPAVVGMYSLGQRVLMLPMNLVGQAILKMFISVAPGAHREGSLTELTEDVFATLLQISLPGLCLLAVVAPELFSFVFGAEWEHAGVYVQWLIPWIVIVFVSSPLTALLRILKRQKRELQFQMLLAVLRVLALCAGGVWLGDATLAIALFAVISAVLNAVFMLWMLSLAGIGVLKTAFAFAREAIIAVNFTFPVLFMKIYYPQDAPLYMSVVAVSISSLAIGMFLFIRIRKFIVSEGVKWTPRGGPPEARS